MSVPIILLCCCCIILGAIARPIGWVAAGLAAVALLVHVLGVV